jgi:hypothetical protein
MLLPILLSSAAASAAPAASPPSWAIALPWHVKVRPEQASSLEGSQRVSLIAARGECEGFQVLLRPPLQKADAELLLLEGPGEPLSPSLFREGYLPVTTPSNSEGATGLWPDPLIPEKDRYVGEKRNALPFDSTKERPLVLYGEICVPHGQTPGTYRGSISMTAEGKTATKIPIDVSVSTVTLPASSTLPNSFGLSLYVMAKGHGVDPQSPAAQKLLDRYVRSLLSHRLSPFGLSHEPPFAREKDGDTTFDFSQYDAELSPYMDGKTSSAGAQFTSVAVREPAKTLTDEQRVKYFRAIQKHHQEKGWKAQLFYYAKDEPKPKDVPIVLKQSKQVRQAKGLPVLVTSPMDDELLGASDIACPVLNCFFPRPGYQTCKKVRTVAQLRAKLPPDGRVWWYQSCMSHGCGGGPAKDPKEEKAFTGWASYMVDHSATMNRAMGPLAFLTGIDGELYWDTIYAYQTKTNPWQSLFEFGGNGDGTLFYPGTPAAVGGATHIPVSSLRLSHIRDGLEDYELFKLLAARKPDKARSLVKRLVKSGYEISPSGENWDEVRRELFDALKSEP